MFVGNLLNCTIMFAANLFNCTIMFVGDLVQLYYNYSQTNDQLRTRYEANDKWRIKISLGKQINK